MRLTSLLLLLIVWLTSMTASAAAPGIINMQGILRDLSNSPLPDQTHSVTFRIYDDSSAGIELWTESNSVITTNGLFSVLMGAVTPVPDSVFNNPNRWLGITVAGNPEMMPRVRLSSVGFAFEADQWSTSGQDLFRLGGNVGVGTSGPNTRLTIWTPNSAGVQEGLRLNNPVGFTGSNNGSSLVFSQDRSLGENFIDAAIAGAQEAPNTSELGYLSFSTKGTSSFSEKMRIRGNGNVGIGTTSPTNKLQVTSAIAGDGIRIDGSSPGFSLGTGGGAAFGEASATGLWSAGAEAGDAVLRSNGGSSLLMQSGFGQPAMELWSGGGVNIYGYTSVYNGLYCNGGVQFTNGLTVFGGIYGAGGCTVQWSCPSDFRLKKNVTPIQDALTVIDQLKGVRYEWRIDEFPEREFPEGTQIGLIAQEVEKVAPEVVTRDRKGYLGVDYEKLVPLLIEGMKEQQRQIERQGAVIDELRQTIGRLVP